LLYETIQQQSNLFERLHNKPFWIRILKSISKEISKQKDIAALIILLVYLRNGIDKPLYDYEKIIYESY
jgi:hypothetical protein